MRSPSTASGAETTGGGGGGGGSASGAARSSRWLIAVTIEPSSWMVSVQFDAAAERTADGDVLQLARQCLEPAQLATLDQQQDQQHQRAESNQHTQQHQCRHRAL